MTEAAAPSGTNVVSLSRGDTEAEKRAAMVEQIEGLLERARVGEIVNVAFVACGPSGTYEMGAAFTLRGSDLEVLGALTTLKASLVERVLNRRHE